MAATLADLAAVALDDVLSLSPTTSAGGSPAHAATVTPDAPPLARRRRRSSAGSGSSGGGAARSPVDAAGHPMLPLPTWLSTSRRSTPPPTSMAPLASHATLVVTAAELSLHDHDAPAAAAAAPQPPPPPALAAAASSAVAAGQLRPRPRGGGVAAPAPLASTAPAARRRAPLSTGGAGAPASATSPAVTGTARPSLLVAGTPRGRRAGGGGPSPAAPSTTPRLTPRQGVNADSARSAAVAAAAAAAAPARVALLSSATTARLRLAGVAALMPPYSDGPATDGVGTPRDGVAVSTASLGSARAPPPLSSREEEAMRVRAFVADMRAAKRGALTRIRAAAGVLSLGEDGALSTGNGHAGGDGSDAGRFTAAAADVTVEVLAPPRRQPPVPAPPAAPTPPPPAPAPSRAAAPPMLLAPPTAPVTEWEADADDAVSGGGSPTASSTAAVLDAVAYRDPISWAGTLRPYLNPGRRYPEPTSQTYGLALTDPVYAVAGVDGASGGRHGVGDGMEPDFADVQDDSVGSGGGGAHAARAQAASAQKRSRSGGSSRASSVARRTLAVSPERPATVPAAASRHSTSPARRRPGAWFPAAPPSPAAALASRRYRAPAASSPPSHWAAAAVLSASLSETEIREGLGMGMPTDTHSPAAFTAPGVATVASQTTAALLQHNLGVDAPAAPEPQAGKGSVVVVGRAETTAHIHGRPIAPRSEAVRSEPHAAPAVQPLVPSAAAPGPIVASFRIPPPAPGSTVMPLRQRLADFASRARAPAPSAASVAAGAALTSLATATSDVVDPSSSRQPRPHMPPSPPRPPSGPPEFAPLLPTVSARSAAAAPSLASAPAPASAASGPVATPAPSLPLPTPASSQARGDATRLAELSVAVAAAEPASVRAAAVPAAAAPPPPQHSGSRLELSMARPFNGSAPAPRTGAVRYDTAVRGALLARQTVRTAAHGGAATAARVRGGIPAEGLRAALPPPHAPHPQLQPARTRGLEEAPSPIHARVRPAGPTIDQRGGVPGAQYSDATRRRGMHEDLAGGRDESAGSISVLTAATVADDASARVLNYSAVAAAVGSSGGGVRLRPYSAAVGGAGAQQQQQQQQQQQHYMTTLHHTADQPHVLPWLEQPQAQHLIDRSGGTGHIIILNAAAQPVPAAMPPPAETAAPRAHRRRPGSGSRTRRRRSVGAASYRGPPPLPPPPPPPPLFASGAFVAGAPGGGARMSPASSHTRGLSSDTESGDDVETQRSRYQAAAAAARQLQQRHQQHLQLQQQQQQQQQQQALQPAQHAQQNFQQPQHGQYGRMYATATNATSSWQPQSIGASAAYSGSPPASWMEPQTQLPPQRTNNPPFDNLGSPAEQRVGSQRTAPRSRSRSAARSQQPLAFYAEPHPTYGAPYVGNSGGGDGGGGGGGGGGGSVQQPGQLAPASAELQVRARTDDGAGGQAEQLLPPTAQAPGVQPLSAAPSVAVVDPLLERRLQLASSLLSRSHVDLSSSRAAPLTVAPPVGASAVALPLPAPSGGRAGLTPSVHPLSYGGEALGGSGGGGGPSAGNGRGSGSSDTDAERGETVAAAAAAAAAAGAAAGPTDARRTYPSLHVGTSGPAAAPLHASPLRPATRHASPPRPPRQAAGAHAEAEDGGARPYRELTPAFLRRAASTQSLNGEPASPPGEGAATPAAAAATDAAAAASRRSSRAVPSQMAAQLPRPMPHAHAHAYEDSLDGRLAAGGAVFGADGGSGSGSPASTAAASTTSSAAAAAAAGAAAAAAFSAQHPLFVASASYAGTRVRSLDDALRRARVAAVGPGGAAAAAASRERRASLGLSHEAQDTMRRLQRLAAIHRAEGGGGGAGGGSSAGGGSGVLDGGGRRSILSRSGGPVSTAGGPRGARLAASRGPQGHTHTATPADLGAAHCAACAGSAVSLRAAGGFETHAESQRRRSRSASRGRRGSEPALGTSAGSGGGGGGGGGGDWGHTVIAAELPGGGWRGGGGGDVSAAGGSRWLRGDGPRRGSSSGGGGRGDGSILVAVPSSGSRGLPLASAARAAYHVARADAELANGGGGGGGGGGSGGAGEGGGVGGASSMRSAYDRGGGGDVDVDEGGDGGGGAARGSYAGRSLSLAELLEGAPGAGEAGGAGARSRSRRGSTTLLSGSGGWPSLGSLRRGSEEGGRVGALVRELAALRARIDEVQMG